MNFLRKFDGTGRTPRQQQRDAMEWLAKGWEQSKIDVINAPVGSGKSAIARAIQLATGAPVITPSNVLVNQYHDDYPTVNILKGKAHYQCKMGLTCHEWQNTLEQKPCEGCPYSTCKRAALDSKPTFFNPISLYYTTRHEDWTPPDVIVVDEAHQLGSMISMLTGTRLRQSLYKFDDRCVNELFLVDFLKDAERKLRKVATQYQKAQDFKKVSEITREYESCAMTRRGLEENGQNYAIWMEKGLYRGKRETFLNIKPIQPPHFVTSRLLAARKIILMSGTILPMDIADLLPDQPYRYLDLPSPIPKENRPVFNRAVPYKMNFETDPAKIAASIEEVIALNPQQNTIIHVTYALSKKLIPHFKIPIMFNTAEDKEAVLERFKKSGGILLAAGMAEGIDLKGDLCRVNIIPKLNWPDLNDEVVKKRRSLADGQEWYALQTLKTLMQQVGRSTRSQEDYSATYILDPMFARMVNQYKHKLPKSFTESIVWQREARGVA